MKSISCKEAVGFILKKEEGRLSLMQRISLWRHLAICSLCRIFSTQNALMNQAMKKRKEEQLTMTEGEKESMIRNIIDKRES
jgi:hypothetical protein